MENRTNPRSFAVITGASTGIGYELAKRCAEDGHDLLIAADEARRYAGYQIRPGQEGRPSQRGSSGVRRNDAGRRRHCHGMEKQSAFGPGIRDSVDMLAEINRRKAKPGTGKKAA